MKVYIAKGHLNYEGFEILGIFDSRVKAETACKNSTGWDWTDVEEGKVS